MGDYKYMETVYNKPTALTYFVQKYMEGSSFRAILDLCFYTTKELSISTGLPTGIAIRNFLLILPEYMERLALEVIQNNVLDEIAIAFNFETLAKQCSLYGINFYNCLHEAGFSISAHDNKITFNSINTQWLSQTTTPHTYLLAI